MYDVKLPSIRYFKNGRNYSGSLRENERRKYLGQTAFNYSVQVADFSGEKKLMAVCYHALPRDNFSKMNEGYIGSFPLSKLGLKGCENWIRSRFGIMESAMVPEKIA